MMGHDVQLCYLCLLIHKLRTSSKGNICIVKMKEWRGMKRLLFPYTQIMSNIQCVESVKWQIKAKGVERQGMKVVLVSQSVFRIFLFIQASTWGPRWHAVSFRKWRPRASERGKPFKQHGHTYGLIPVCTRVCLSRSCRRAKVLEQNGHGWALLLAPLPQLLLLWWSI